MTKARSLCLLVAGLSLVTTTAVADNVPPVQALTVGVGTVDLTWHVGLGRVPDERVPATPDPLTFSGLHTRPLAKAIWVNGNGAPFVLVRADILLVTGDLYEAVAARAERELGLPPEQLVLAATHTHVANTGLFPHAAHGALYRSADPREKEFLARRITAAIAIARANNRPARLAIGAGSVTTPTLNRRYTAREADDQPPFGNDISRIDAELGILRFDDAATGRPIATLMNYGVHPVVLIDNPLISADFIGLTERQVEAATGAHAIWWTGAQGDQDPVTVRRSYPEAEWTARLFADEAIRVASSLAAAPLVSARLASKVVPVPPPGGELFASHELAPVRVPAIGPSSVLIPTSVRLSVAAFETTQARTALASWPGEVVRDLGVRLKQRLGAMGFDTSFVLGLANDWGGYWLTPEEYDRGMYERTYHFYGRESAYYIEHHLLDLAKSILTGSTPEQVALPPHAAADRATTRSLAEAGLAGEDATAAAHLPPPDLAVSALRQPSNVARLSTVVFEWRGGSPDVPTGWIPAVTVQRLDGNAWVTVAREGSGEMLLEHRAPALGDNRWSARWQPMHDAATGTYRIAVAGTRMSESGAERYTIDSQTFTVAACTSCLVAGALNTTSAAGATSLALKVTYRIDGGFRLTPGVVTTGNATVAVVKNGSVVSTLELGFISSVERVEHTVIVNDISARQLPVTVGEMIELGRFRATVPAEDGAQYVLVEVRDSFGNTYAA